jgi:hypothetical protein
VGQAGSRAGSLWRIGNLPVRALQKASAQQKSSHGAKKYKVGNTDFSL